MERELTTLHHALSEASVEMPKAEDRAAMVTFTFRASNEDLAKAREIAERHGTDLSKFLRKCVELLPKDFMP